MKALLALRDFLLNRSKFPSNSQASGETIEKRIAHFRNEQRQFDRRINKLEYELRDELTLVKIHKLEQQIEEIKKL